MKLSPITTNFTLKDHVYEKLKDAIAGTDIYDDAAELRLDERSLAEQLGISRTPLREAIARLEKDGLVVVVQRKSMAEILEMIVAWAALESMAARLAAERASDAEIATLRKMVSKYDDGALGIRLSEYSDDNIRFHQRILEISKCSLIIEALESRDADLAGTRVREHTMKLHDHVHRTWTRLEQGRAANSA